MSDKNTWPGWECTKQLGKGAFGKVFQIEKTEYGKTYKAALKVITVPQDEADIEEAFTEGMDSESVSEYFQSFVENITEEFALMSEFKGHSNIVSYEDHMVVERKDRIGWDILIRMELLHPLHKWALLNPLAEEDVIKLGIDIAKALEVCHKRNIIHRDIKPENIFVNNFGDYKLGDFGIARTVEKTVSNLSKKGTYSYMAPEVYRGQAYGAAADIYSLGMVLYRCLNDNRIPFLPTGVIKYTDRENALERRMSGEQVPEPKHGSQQLKQIIMKTLSYSPGDRIKTAAELRELLESCIVKSNVKIHEEIITANLGDLPNETNNQFNETKLDRDVIAIYNNEKQNIISIQNFSEKNNEKRNNNDKEPRFLKNILNRFGFILFLVMLIVLGITLVLFADTDRNKEPSKESSVSEQNDLIVEKISNDISKQFEEDVATIYYGQTYLIIEYDNRTSYDYVADFTITYYDESNNQLQMDFAKNVKAKAGKHIVLEFVYDSAYRSFDLDWNVQSYENHIENKNAK